MADRVEMKHKAFISTARPLEADVPKWEPEGWTRVQKPSAPRKRDRAAPLAKPDDSAESA